MSTVPDPDVIPFLLPARQIHLLAGAAGVGKTALLAWLLTQLRDKQPIFGHPVGEVGSISFLAGDRPWVDHAQWFDAVGWPDVPHYSLVDDPGADIDRLIAPVGERSFPLLHRGLEALNVPVGASPPPLVVVDPLGLFLGIDPVRSYLQVAKHLVKLARACLARPMTLLASFHTGKVKGDPNERYLRPRDHILGSTALVGFTGTQITLLGSEEVGEAWCECHWSAHHAAPECFRLVRDAKTGVFVPYHDEKEDDQLLQLLHIIASEPVAISVKAIEERLADAAIGISRRTMYNYLDRLLRDGKIEKIARGYYRITVLQ